MLLAALEGLPIERASMSGLDTRLAAVTLAEGLKELGKSIERAATKLAKAIESKETKV